MPTSELSEDVQIRVLLGGATQKLERDDEQNNVNARASEHAVRGDMPRAEQEALTS